MPVTQQEDRLRWLISAGGISYGLVEYYKRVRRLVQDGEQHQLLSPSEGETTAVQYVAADSSDFVIFVLRHPHNVLVPTPRLYPRGLRADETYEVSCEEFTFSGASLMSRGLGVGLEGDLASAMIEVREAD